MISPEAVAQLMRQCHNGLSERPLSTKIQQCDEANIHLRIAKTLKLRQTCSTIRKVSEVNELKQA